MTDRIKAAADARTDEQFVIGARTDALAVEGLDKTLARVQAYAAAGADFIFAEAVTDLSLYKKFADASGLPILANITEFGMTPMWTTDELRTAGVSLVLYPLSAFRAANKAAQNVYQRIRKMVRSRMYLMPCKRVPNSMKALAIMPTSKSSMHFIKKNNDYERSFTR